ncbi:MULTISPECIES: PilW family protein [unclassified Fusibacter]|uniref:PilW family protein n=1 Tax=unclassified Fusibacter TaxID=2624464 RepID=UPI0010130ADD|nr:MULTISPECIES: type II secretion system protein [unclassified Fusibacter]MCK8058899.1 prepilin-type N-terminal cleavage/methylation domain-containing protein [Fusibacter sp. A2]NPE21973.1 prepilin-type N-terminal cleavage/methylation domain-containing protein [Fusibacter sp. A1]RXV61541.1 prepilin-type N-terminal cleavage/methylation domain-containing protein [Fusibacter sp. A1]
MRHSRTKGLTLIELIVVIAILSIVVTAVFSFFNFEQKMFFKTTDRFDVQSDTRLILLKATKELRNCSELELIEIDKALDEIDVNTAYNYAIISGDGSVKFYEYTTTPSIGYVTSSSGSYVDDTLTSSYFSRVNGSTLKLSISQTLNNETYSLESEILLNNLTISGASQIPVTDDQLAVKYLK